MKTDSGLNLTVLPSQMPTELILREGEADKIVHPKPILITGTLLAPAQFLDGKEVLFKPENSHLRIYSNGKLELYLQDNDPHCTHVITGVLSPDPELGRWGINSTSRWSVGPFIEFIKARRFFFETGTECNEIINSLRKWEAEVQTIIKQHTDTAGNSLVSLEKKVSGITMKNKFRLFIPIFQGYPKEKIEVEIGYEPQSNEVRLFLISEDLYELDLTLREKYLSLAVTALARWGCPKVQVS